tara:strand:+ start:1714 stop:1944 length:231 start_codon:yes stop_codon:yes gene_type:complete
MPHIPVIKICGNPSTIATWNDCIDLDVTDLILGDCSIDDAAQLLSMKLYKISNGDLTATEALNEGQLILPRTTAAL